MSESTDNSKNPDYREYYLLNAWWGNDWVPMCYCSHCGLMPGPDVSFNIYKVKARFYCRPCYDTIKKRHLEKGVKWEGKIYWNGDCTDLK
ncbi:MAG: hypothetical protein ACRD6U_04865 [Nitrososphaeraceae archaeon]